MDKKKFMKIALTGCGILLCVFIIMTSYAYWQMTKKQNKWNEMVAACLDFELENSDENNTGISLQSAWPISDSEGLKLDGYSFKITNKCSTPVNYIIALESLEKQDVSYMEYEYIKISIDNEKAKLYSSLNTLPNDEPANGIVVRDTKEIKNATVAGNSINTHTIKIWIDNSAPVSQQSKAFSSRIKITGGQGIEPGVIATDDSCFDISDSGEITNYKLGEEGCTKSVVIPATIGNTSVKSIDTDAFRGPVLISSEVSDYTKERRAVSLIADDTLLTTGTGKAYYFIVYQEGEEADNLISNLYAYGAENFGLNYEVDTYVYGKNTVTKEGKPLGELALGQTETFFEYDMDTVGTRTVTEEQRITIDSVDFSAASNLEKIEAGAFSNVPIDVFKVDQYTNYDRGLTSVNFGDNINEIEFGHNAFANADLEDLKLYSTFYTKQNIIGQDDYNLPFGGSNIENFVIEAAGGKVDIVGVYSDDLSVVTYFVSYATNITNMSLINIEKSSDTINDCNIGTLNVPNTINLDESYWSADKINKIILPDGLTDIPADAFENVKVDEMILPNSIKTIGNKAFYASTINSINLPEGLTSIGNYAFYAANNLKDITIPSTITNIGEYALYANSENYAKNITINRPNLEGVTLGFNWVDDYSKVSFIDQ